jgi:hypothetical protein
MKRHYLIIEKDPKYADVIKKRLEHRGLNEYTEPPNTDDHPAPNHEPTPETNDPAPDHEHTQRTNDPAPTENKRKHTNKK